MTGACRVALLFPGQGSQAVGMGRALADLYPTARAVFDEADRVCAAEGSDTRLSDLIFNGPADRLTLTEHAQPAILTVSVAAWKVLEEHGVRPSLVAGHSLGEYSANVAAGTFSFADAVRLVRRRGRYMQDAVPPGGGAMAAVLGADAAIVEQACRESADGDVVAPANFNAPGQTVIAGSAAAVARASARAKALGARRVIPLSVSAPFHCALMRPAEARLEPELRRLAVLEPRVPIVANVDAQPKRTAASAVDALVRQVSAPVRWQDVVERLASEGITTYVEVGPGSILRGLVEKIRPGARVCGFGSPGDLDAVLRACSI